ncbi:MAG TPA: pyridoxal phosphate-dependent aminotransferase [Thermoanaerobaculia bacterium]|nr:pyridoxal phosphate-dependent aminotransferase [Thermoanaerobaculia bacterium]
MPGRRLPSLSLIRRVVAEAAPGTPDLSLGRPMHAVPGPVREALAAAVAAGDFAYTANAGRQDLRRAVARRRPHHGSDGASVVITTGSQEALALAILGLVEPGDEVVIPQHAYPSYEALVGVAGGRAVRAPRQRLAAAVSPATRLLVLASPDNPTGEVAPAEDWERLAALAEQSGFWLLSDEVYDELWLGDEPPRYPQGARVLHVGGISKSLALTGLRLGWLIAAPGLVRRLLPLHQHLVTCAPSLAQAAALAGLALPPAALDPVRQLYRQRWQVLRGLLPSLPGGVRWQEPRGAFYLYLDVRARVRQSTEALALDLARRGVVVVVPGEAFGSAGRGWLRLSFAAAEETLREGVGRLADALRASP